MARIARCVLGLLAFPMLLTACRVEIEPDEDTGLEPAVQAMLERSASDWNRGDLDAFLSDYQDVASTTFVSSEGLLTGVDEIRRHYAFAFQPGAARDSLRFESVHVRSLSPMIGIVTARWVLHDDGVTVAAGPMTLVMRRTQAGWRITHDHSSADPATAGSD
jgi:uncharacterized protein (TIGR02246 family)